MARFFVRGATPPGGRDGTPFNNSYNLAVAVQRVQQARAVNPYSKFKPDTTPNQGASQIVSPPGAVRLDNKTAMRGAMPGIKDAGKQTMDAKVAHDASLPPGPRPAALRARGIGPTSPGEAFSEAAAAVVLGGRPLGGQVGFTGHAAPERPLAMDAATGMRLGPLRR